MRLSNNSLMFLLVLIIAVSMVGTFLSIGQLGKIRGAPESETTGFATDSSIGNVTLNIQELAQIRFITTNDSLNWGTGAINTSGGFNNCTMATTNGYTNVGCQGFTNLSGTALLIENYGTTDLNVTLNSTVNWSDFIGAGCNPSCHYQALVADYEQGSCTGTIDNYNVTFQNVTKFDPNICTNMSDIVTNNTLRLDVLIRIGQGSLTGQRNATFTVTGTTFT